MWHVMRSVMAPSMRSVMAHSRRGGGAAPPSNWVDIKDWPGITVLSETTSAGTIYDSGVWSNPASTSSLPAQFRVLNLSVQFPEPLVGRPARIVFDEWVETPSAFDSILQPAAAIMQESLVFSSEPAPANSFVPSPVEFTLNTPAGEWSSTLQVTQALISGPGAASGYFQPSIRVELFLDSVWVNVFDATNVVAYAINGWGGDSDNKVFFPFAAEGNEGQIRLTSSEDLGTVLVRVTVVSLLAESADPADELVSPLTVYSDGVLLLESATGPFNDNIAAMFPSGSVEEGDLTFYEEVTPGVCVVQVVQTVVLADSAPSSLSTAFQFRVQVAGD